MKRLLRRPFRATSCFITAGVILVVLLLYTMGVGPLDLLELKSYDLRLRSMGIRKPSSNILLCVIDEKSLKKEGRWPWPRWKMAKLIKLLSEAGAKVIAFDIGFFEPDEHLDKKLLDELEAKLSKGPMDQKQLLSFVLEWKRKSNNDLLLAQAIQESRARIVLGYFFHMGVGSIDYRVEYDQLQTELSRIERSKYPIVVYKGQEPANTPFTKAYVPVANLDQITRAADASGYFNIFPDADGIVRKMPLAIQCGGDVFSPLSVQALWNSLDRPQLSVIVSNCQVSGIKMGQRFIPTDENGNLLINYLGPPKTFPHFSITDILSGDFPRDLFRGAIVLVGATAVGIYDQRNTPFSPVYPGLEVHATVIDNILTQHYLRKPEWVGVYDVCAIIFLGLLGAIATGWLAPYRGGMVAGGLFIAHVLTCTGIFWRYGLWINIVYPSVALALTHGLLTTYYYLTQADGKKRLKALRRILKKSEHVKFEGEKRELTVLFSDITAFNRLLEEAASEELLSQFNEYLTIMANIVSQYGGTLDKYIGDALVVIYGSPIPLEDHPHKACHTALNLVEALGPLNAKWAAEGKDTLDVGIGISTGSMLVGATGSRQWFDYTVMGEGADLAARLEGANTFYGTRILISEATYQVVKDTFTCLEVDTIRPKEGKATTRIYTLLGHGTLSGPIQEAIGYFEKALESYKARNWQQALDLLHTALQLDPSLQVAEVYIKRCRYLANSPPPPDWDGVFRPYA